MLRVVHVCPRYAPATGGVELFFAKLSDALVQRGDAVEVWTTDARSVRAFASPEGERFPAGRDTIGGVTVRRYPIRYLPAHRYVLTAAHLLPFGRAWKSNTLRWSPLVPGLLRDAGRNAGVDTAASDSRAAAARTAGGHAAGLETGTVDVVHAAALPYSSLLYAALRLARRRRARLIASPFTHLGRPGAEGDRIRATYLSPLNVGLLREADRVLVQTRAEREALARAGVDAARLILVGMGVDIAACTLGQRGRGRERWGLPPDAVVVGHLANKSWDKGTVDLLDASERLWASGRRFHLLLAGHEMPSFTRRWQTVTARDRIVNLGELSDDDKRDFYAAIDVFALPSYVESFGISPLEAAVNRVPSVAYRLGGPAEVFEHEVTGLLAPAGDVAGLADVLARVIDSEAERRRLGEAASAMAAGHTWTRAIGRVLACYDAPADASNGAAAGAEGRVS